MSDLSHHIETMTLVIVVLIGVILCFFQIFQVGIYPLSYIPDERYGTVIQAIATIFAIVFSISLVAVQLFSENISYRLVQLYVTSVNFIIPFTFNMSALTANILLLTYYWHSWFMPYGIILSMMAILSLIPFFIYTINFLKPTHVVVKLIDCIRSNEFLDEDHSNIELYRKKIQPIEDIISSFIKKTDYATTHDLIRLVSIKMNDILQILKNRIKQDNANLTLLVDNMSRPFAKLIGNIAIIANKNDSIEVTIHLINMIAKFISELYDARLIPAFKNYDVMMDRIILQAEYRFSSEEYHADIANLKIATANARISFSEFVG